MSLNRAIYFVTEIKELLVAIKRFRMSYTTDTGKNEKTWQCLMLRRF